MPSQLYRKRLMGRISASIIEAESVEGVDHDGTRGTAREIFLRQLLGPTLPSGLKAGTGIITDPNDQQSGQLDMIVYAPHVLPPLLWDELTGVFPLDACFSVIEVKSRLTAARMAEAVAAARKVHSLTYSTRQLIKGDLPFWSTFSTTARVEIPVPKPTRLEHPAKAIVALFAFASDLSQAGKSDLDRFLEAVPEAHEDPPIQLMCVAGRGFWRFDPQDKSWSESPANNDRDEVIDFLGVLANSAEGVLATRQFPRLGSYIIEPRDYYRIPASPGKRTLVLGSPPVKR